MRAWAIGNAAPTIGFLSMLASLASVSHLRGSIARKLGPRGGVEWVNEGADGGALEIEVREDGGVAIEAWFEGLAAAGGGCNGLERADEG